VCNSNFHSQQNEKTAPVMGEITADQILDMPIVFADEPSQEEVKQVNDDNSSYFMSASNQQNIVVKEEPVDEDDVLSPTMTRTTIPERLKIKQVCRNVHYIKVNSFKFK
jgi:hypothetical protein